MNNSKSDNKIIDVQVADNEKTTKQAIETLSDGKHILAEFWHCACDEKWLCATEPLCSTLNEAIKAVGLTQVGKSTHEFHDDAGKISGVTVSLLLAESHLCLHTWGEQRAVTLDIYVCNFQQDNSDKSTQLFEICRDIFQPEILNSQVITRQHLPLIRTQ